jgi:hypothetical protein
MERDERNGMPVQTAARLIADIALKKTVKPLYAIGFANKAVCILQRLLPVSLVNFVVGRRYMNSP